MTAFSAKVDEHHQWFNTPPPGRLSDGFGMRTNEFYRAYGPLTGKTRTGTLHLDADGVEVLQ